MKQGGWLSRIKGRTNGADPFAAMGAAQRGSTALPSSPVGVPVASAPAQDGSTGQFPVASSAPAASSTPPAATQPAAPSATPPRAERPPAPAAARVADAWGNVCDHFALQVVTLAEQLRPALDQLEADEQDAERLGRLYTVDHAITRIRRAARDLRILAGRGDDETTGPTSSLVDTIRVALSSIERYTQVSIGSVTDLAVVGYVGDDVAALLAALLDNATKYSPSTVTISGHLVSDGGVMFRIEDSGIGLSDAHIAALNTVLDSEIPDIDDHTARHTGFAVVHRLARKHGIKVRLAARAAPAGESGGTTAMVTLPASLLTEIPDPPLAMVPAASGPAETSVDPRATAHLTVARTPTRRGPVAAVPEPGAVRPSEETPSGAEPDAAATEEPSEAAYDFPAPNEPGPDVVTQNGYAEPAIVRDETPPPLPRREPTSLRAPDTLPPLVAPAPEPSQEEAAERRRAFADDVAAFSAAFGGPAENEPESEPEDQAEEEPEELPEFLPGYRSYSEDEEDVDEEPAGRSRLEESHVVEPPSLGGFTGASSPPDTPNDSGNQVPR